MSNVPTPPAADAPVDDFAPTPDWQRLPERARLLCLIEYLWLAAPAILGGLVLGKVLVENVGWPAARWQVPLVLAVAALAIAIWLGRKRYRHTFWKLDSDGLAVRRGRFWLRETRVPTTRVQHLDLKRGPLQRRRDLATLVVHTAGTRHSAVSVSHLDHADAERLRDHLARQIDHDDDA